MLHKVHFANMGGENVLASVSCEVCHYLDRKCVKLLCWIHCSILIQRALHWARVCIKMIPVFISKEEIQNI